MFKVGIHQSHHWFMLCVKFKLYIVSVTAWAAMQMVCTQSKHTLVTEYEVEEHRNRSGRYMLLVPLWKECCIGKEWFAYHFSGTFEIGADIQLYHMTS